jgi:DNA repair exonuclease SbcCD ATPase subunit
MLITGPNASGKTSILKGITWGLCGATQDTSIDGKGADVLVMDGEGRALVELGVTTETGQHTIKRSIPHALSVDGVQGGVRRTTELLEAVLAPVTPQQLLVCFESSRVLRMNDQERKKFLASVIGLNTEIGLPEVIQALRRWLPTIGMSAEEGVGQQALNKFATTIYAQYNYPFLFKLFSDDKKALVASIKAAEGIRPIETPENLPSLESLTRRKILLEAELELSKAKEIKPEDNTAAILVKPDLEKIAGKIKNLRAIYEQAMAAGRPLEGKIALLESQSQQIGSAAKQCPFFAQCCPLPAEDIERSVAQTSALVDHDKKLLATYSKRATKAIEELRKAEDELAKAEEEINRFGAIWDHDQKVSIEHVRPVAEIEAELLLLNNRYNEVVQALAQAQLARINQATIDSANLALTDLPVAELLVAAFAPSGIPTMILGEHMGRLEELATQASRTITGGRYEITFSVAEGELDVFVVSDNKKRPISSLSASEEVWVSFIISHVVNQYIGNRILMLDEAFILDEQMQRGLEDFLLSVRQMYDNVFICATIPPGEPFLQRLTNELGGSNCSRINLTR